MHPRLAARTPFQRLRRPLLAVVFGLVPFLVFIGISQTTIENDQVVSHSRLNLFGVALAGLGLALMVELLAKDGRWIDRWLPRTLLAIAAAVLCAVQIVYSLGLFDT